MGRLQSGQMLETVNLAPHGFEGSNPSLPTTKYADVAQLVEHLHGKEKVTGSIPVVGSTALDRYCNIR